MAEPKPKRKRKSAAEYQQMRPDVCYTIMSFRVNAVELEAIRAAVPPGMKVSNFLKDLVFASLGR